METAALRNKLLDIIANADKKELQRFSDFVENSSKDDLYVVTEVQKTILDQRLKKHTENPSSGKDWDDLASELSSNYNV